MFSEQIDENRDFISSSLEEGISTEISSALEHYFDDYFLIHSPEDLKEDFNVVASDAGRNQIQFKNNLNLFIIRASAMDNHGEETRKLFTGIVRPYRQRSYKDFSDRSSEIVELESILERLEELDLGKETFVLIDGSLLTRMLVLPTELRMSDYRDRKLDLIDRFHELLQRSRENDKLHVAGVSKDSNTDILYSTLTENLIHDEIDGKDLSDQSAEKIRENFRNIKHSPLETKKMIEGIEQSEDVDLSRLKDLLEYYRDTYSDSALIESLTDETGITKPVEVGNVSAKFRSLTEDIRDDVDGFIDNNFPHSVEDRDDEESYRRRIEDSLQKLMDYPSITTSYWVPERNAQPIRVDMFSDEWDKGGKLQELDSTRFLEVNDTMKKLLRLLQTGYGGETMHNVWISQADNSASLTQTEVNRVFSPILSKKLGVNLRKYMRRRDKRA